jgi:hypothetical protein
MDPDAEGEEARGLAMLRDAQARIAHGVAAVLPGWVERSVARIVDAWGQLDPDRRRAVLGQARDAGAAAAARVGRELGALFALDVAGQRRTPLQIVRTAVVEPTEVLWAAGVPPVGRDAFAERACPDDVYGLVPTTLGDLGDRELAPLHLVWGMAKATILKARRAD